MDGGHTVLIVGCSEDDLATEFLYLDPYPGGSTVKYNGGIAADSYPSKCFFWASSRSSFSSAALCCARTVTQMGNGAVSRGGLRAKF
jgi:hypothetical protein